MEIQVSLPDATSADHLAQRLAAASTAMVVSVDPSRTGLRVRAGTESNRTVMSVIDTVQAWLAEYGAGAARLSIGGRSYTINGPGRIVA